MRSNDPERVFEKLLKLPARVLQARVFFRLASPIVGKGGREVAASIAVQFAQPVAVHSCGGKPGIDRRMAEQGGESGEGTRFEIVSHNREQEIGRRSAYRSSGAVTCHHPALRKLLLDVGNQRLRWHSHRDFLGGKATVPFRQRSGNGQGLIGRTIDDLDLIVLQREGNILPGRHFETAVGVEAVGDRIGGEDERRHPIGHEVQNLPLGSVQVRRAHEDHFPIGAAFPVRDGEQASRLQIPEFQRVEQLEIGFLHDGQGLPSGVFREVFKLSPAFGYLAEVQAVAGQFAVQLGKHLAQGQASRQVRFGRQVGNEFPQVALIGSSQGFDPGQLLGEPIGEGMLGNVQQFGELSHGDRGGGAERATGGLRSLQQQFLQSASRTSAGRRKNDPRKVQGRLGCRGRQKPLDEVVGGSGEGRAIPSEKNAIDGHDLNPRDRFLSFASELLEDLFPSYTSSLACAR